MLRYLYPFLFFSAACLGDFVIIGGTAEDPTGGSDAPTYPLIETFSLGQTASSYLTLPLNVQGIVYGVGIDPFRGTVVYAGQAAHPTTPFLFKGSVINSEITSLGLPPTLSHGALAVAAFDSNGTAFAVGGTYDAVKPLIVQALLGANTATQISVPLVGGYLQTLAIGSNDVVIAGGQADSSAPLICTVAPGSNQASVISLPDPSVLGVITCAQVASNGTAFLAGQNTSDSVLNGQALIYSLIPGSATATAISIPGTNPNDGGIINSLAIRSDGTVLLVGYTGLSSFTHVPLIYKISPGSTSATTIPFPYGDFVSFTSIVLDSQGNAIIAGYPDLDGPPVVYRLNLETSEFTPLTLPNSLSGIIQSMSISQADTVVLTGQYTDAHALLLYTLSSGSNRATSIATRTTAYQDSGYSVQIYNCDGPYDIRHMRPSYYVELSEAQNALNQAGL